MTDKAEWLAGLKVGDPVVVRTGFPEMKRVHRIARFTKTLIVLDDGWRFRRKNGWTPGIDPWNFYWLEKPTRAQARKAKARKAAR